MLEKTIKTVYEIKDKIDFCTLSDDVIQSEIFQKIALEIYNWWPWSCWLSRVNGAIKFFIDVLPVYSALYSKTYKETLEILANARNCNYTNWFQNANIPKDIWTVLIYKDMDEFYQKHPSKEYICPKCRWHSTDPYACNVWDCDWKVYWLFGDLGEWCHILFMDQIAKHPIPQNIFKPINL